mgnify:CR=1 FL=1|tara:strand:- start:500 stop:754 length:255 start_codon:yes stop_codon:yes gene_type:complete
MKDHELHADVTQCVRAGHHIAKTLRDFACNIERQSKLMEERKDLGCCIDIINTVMNINSNLRVDTLMRRSINALDDAAIKELDK